MTLTAFSISTSTSKETTVTKRIVALGVALGILAGSGVVLGLVATRPRRIVTTQRIQREATQTVTAAETIVVGEISSVGDATHAPAVTENGMATLKAKGLTNREIALGLKNDAERMYIPYTVSVTKTLKGADTTSVSFYVFAGISGAVVEDLQDNPKFTVGEKVILLLARNYNGMASPIGVYQVKGNVAESHSMGRDKTEALGQVLSMIEQAAQQK
jgi:hypothetical protein